MTVADLARCSEVRAKRPSGHLVSPNGRADDDQLPEQQAVRELVLWWQTADRTRTGGELTHSSRVQLEGAHPCRTHRVGDRFGCATAWDASVNGC